MPFAYDPNGNLVGTTGTGTGLNASSINGVAVTGTASSGKVITATSATSATWQTPNTFSPVYCGVVNFLGVPSVPNFGTNYLQPFITDTNVGNVGGGFTVNVSNSLTVLITGTYLVLVTWTCLGNGYPSLDFILNGGIFIQPFLAFLSNSGSFQLQGSTHLTLLLTVGDTVQFHMYDSSGGGGLSFQTNNFHVILQKLS